MDTPFFILVVIAIIIVSVLSFVFNKKQQIKRKLKKAEFKKICDFKDGDVAKVVGQVEFIQQPLTAPLSKRECSFYYIKVQKKVSSGKSSHWDTIIEEEVSSDFLIKGETHYALVKDKNIKCYIVQDASYSSGFLNDADAVLENYLNSKGHNSEGFLGMNKTMRYKEGVLEENETVAAYGKGVWKDASQLNLPEKYGKILEITSDKDLAIHLSDDPSTTIKKVKKVSVSQKDYNKGKRYKK